MKRLLNLRRFHWTVVFMLAGAFAAIFVFATYNLFHYSMAKLSVLRIYGLTAIHEGALNQTLEIMIGGAFALACYFGFKLWETELVGRYRAWSRTSD